MIGRRRVEPVGARQPFRWRGRAHAFDVRGVRSLGCCHADSVRPDASLRQPRVAPCDHRVSSGGKPSRTRNALTASSRSRLALRNRTRKNWIPLAAAWRAGDVARRWEVLSALLERIHVRQDRKVAGYTPRLDRANRVRLLTGTALDTVYGWSESEAEAEQHADGPGADFLVERSGRDFNPRPDLFRTALWIQVDPRLTL